MFTKTASAVALFTVAASGLLADITPISRTTALSASWFQADPPFPGTGGSNSDGTSGFGYYSNAISSGSGHASQTSYVFTNRAYANASGGGVSGTSIMHPSGATGTSTFTYVFELTVPTLLYITGSLDRGSPFVSYGNIEIYNSADTRVYGAVGNTDNFATSTPIADTYLAAAGQYRFVVSGGNSGASGGAPTGSTSAYAFLTVPGPGAVAPLTLGALLARRLRR